MHLVLAFAQPPDFMIRSGSYITAEPPGIFEPNGPSYCNVFGSKIHPSRKKAPAVSCPPTNKRPSVVWNVNG